MSLKPKTQQADIEEMSTFLIGYLEWAKTNDPELYEQHKDMIPAGFQPPVEPIHSNDVLARMEQNFMSKDDIHISDMPEQMQELYNRLHTQGVIDGDGYVSVAEGMISGAAVGNAELAKHPEKYNITEEQKEFAKDLLDRHGIDDPEGHLATGIAVNAERLAQRANEGLGFEQQAPTMQIASPQLANVNTLTNG